VNDTRKRLLELIKHVLIVLYLHGGPAWDVNEIILGVQGRFQVVTNLPGARQDRQDLAEGTLKEVIVKVGYTKNLGVGLQHFPNDGENREGEHKA
jgi:hypothetical protein